MSFSGFLAYTRRYFDDVFANIDATALPMASISISTIGAAEDRQCVRAWKPRPFLISTNWPAKSIHHLDHLPDPRIKRNACDIAFAARVFRSKPTPHNTGQFQHRIAIDIAMLTKK
jgi:hypothetical protein